jgi:hypothetical protein
MAAAAGCGGTTGSRDQTAAVVPRTAATYVQLELAPSTRERIAVRSLLSTLPGAGPPLDRLTEAIDGYLARHYGPHGPHFTRNFTPWLGDRLALFSLAHHGASGPSGLVLATNDPARARSWLHGRSVARTTSGRSYDGVPYRYSRATGTAIGLVSGLVVIGSRAAFTAAVRAARTGGLATDADFLRRTGQVGGERIGFVWRRGPSASGLLAIRAERRRVVLDGALEGVAFRRPVKSALAQLFPALAHHVRSVDGRVRPRGARVLAHFVLQFD